VDSELIKKIADEIVRRFNEQPEEKKDPEALVIVCDHVARGSDAKVSIWEHFGGRVHIAALNAKYSAPELEVEEKSEQELIAEAAGSESIVLLSPRVSMLQNMASGMDEGCLENIFVRSLLWGKNVHIMLDYTPPRYKRGTFYQKISEALDTLVEMGVAVFTYGGGEGAKDGLSLVTENEVTEAYRKKNTRILCAKGAIVTPAARDRAGELKIKIEWQGN
jgi:hypothetical protein